MALSFIGDCEDSLIRFTYNVDWLFYPRINDKWTTLTLIWCRYVRHNWFDMFRSLSFALWLLKLIRMDDISNVFYHLARRTPFVFFSEWFSTYDLHRLNISKDGKITSIENINIISVVDVALTVCWHQNLVIIQFFDIILSSLSLYKI